MEQNTISIDSFISFLKEKDDPSFFNRIFHSSSGSCTLSFEKIKINKTHPEKSYIKLMHVEHHYGDDVVYIFIYLDERGEFLNGRAEQKYWEEKWTMDEDMIMEWITPCLKEEIISYITNLYEIKEPSI